MKHITSITEIDKTWCGDAITVGFGEPAFRTLDQVAMNGLFPGESRKRVCKTCIELCVSTLLKNIEVTNDNQS